MYPHETPPMKVPANPLDNAANIIPRSHVSTSPIVFEVNYDGVFLEYPGLKYHYGKTMILKVCKSKRMNFDQLLDLLAKKLEQDIRYVYFSPPRKSLEEGLHLIEGECHMRQMYETGDYFGLVHLFVAHAPQNLAGFYLKNLIYDSYDEETLSRFKKHADAMLVATSNSVAAQAAWEDEEGRSPPLRTPPSERTIKSTNLECKHLFKDFLHSDSLESGLYFSEEDCMPGVVCLDVPAMDVGWSRSPPFEWQNVVLGDHGSKVTTLSNDSFADSVVLDVCGPAVHEQGGTSVLPTTHRRVPQKTNSRKLKFGGRTSYFRRRNMLTYVKALRNSRENGGFGEKIRWFLMDGRLQSRLL